ncbi:hypothetical protein GH733_001366 [Mirounga leonina]|nr:hypothetical protein GH733_001366 [Mirounga leonina]
MCPCHGFCFQLGVLAALYKCEIDHKGQKFGANSYGQLGLGHKEDVLLPQQLNDFCKPEYGGGLFVCGLNKDGQLGLGHTEDVLYFTACRSLLGCPIQQVACGWDFTIILTESGQVLSCGSNSFGQLGVPHGPGRCVVPQAIELLREKVVCIAAGLRHALAATASGIVFQWGTGLASSGRRLCPGQTLPPFLTAKEPSRVTGLENSKATYVLAGSDHSASLTDAGELYVWGSNKHGLLASLAAFLPVPQKIEAHCFQNEKVTSVWSGWTHLVAQTGERAAEKLWLVFRSASVIPGKSHLLHIGTHRHTLVSLHIYEAFHWSFKKFYDYFGTEACITKRPEKLLPWPSVTGEKHPGLPVQSDSAAHINGNKICSQGQRQLISGTRSYLALVVFTSASGELLLGLTCRPHQQPALRLILEGIRSISSQSPDFLARDASSEIWVADLGAFLARALSTLVATTVDQAPETSSLDPAVDLGKLARIPVSQAGGAAFSKPFPSCLMSVIIVLRNFVGLLGDLGLPDLLVFLTSCPPPSVLHTSLGRSL